MPDIKNIDLTSLSDTEVLALVARFEVENIDKDWNKSMEILYTKEEAKEKWNKVIEYYTLYTKEVADKVIEEEIGEEFCLGSDLEECKEQLIIEQHHQQSVL